MKLAVLVLLLLTHACLLTGSLKHSQFHQTHHYDTKSSDVSNSPPSNVNHADQDGWKDQTGENEGTPKTSSEADKTEPENADAKEWEQSVLRPLWEKTPTYERTPGNGRLEKDAGVRRFKIDTENKDGEKFNLSKEKSWSFYKILVLIGFMNTGSEIKGNSNIESEILDAKKNENFLSKVVKEIVIEDNDLNKRRIRRVRRAATTSASSNTSKFVGLVVGASRNGKLNPSVKKLLTSLYDNVWKQQSTVTQQYQEASPGDKNGKGKKELKYGSILGAFPSYVKENFHGCSKESVLRDKDVVVPDYNSLNTLFVLHCLVEAVVFGPAVTPNHANMVKAVEALSAFHTHNLDKGNTMLTMWTEKLKKDTTWDVFPENLVMATSKGANTFEKLEALVKEDATCTSAKNGLAKIQKLGICMDHYNTSLGEALNDPSTAPDLMTSFSNLALGALFRAEFKNGENKKDSVFKAELEVWEHTNTDFYSLIEKLKAMAVVFHPVEPLPATTTPTTATTTNEATKTPQSKSSTGKTQTTKTTTAKPKATKNGISLSAKIPGKTDNKTSENHESPTSKKKSSTTKTKPPQKSTIKPQNSEQKKASPQTNESDDKSAKEVTVKSTKAKSNKKEAVVKTKPTEKGKVRSRRDVHTDKQKNVIGNKPKKEATNKAKPKPQTNGKKGLTTNASPNVKDKKAKTQTPPTSTKKPKTETKIVTKNNKNKQIKKGDNAKKVDDAKKGTVGSNKSKQEKGTNKKTSQNKSKVIDDLASLLDKDNQILDSVSFFGIQRYLVQSRRTTVLVPFEMSDDPVDLVHNKEHGRRYNSVDLTTLATTLHALVVSSATRLVDMQEDLKLQGIVKSSMRVLTWYISNEKDLLQSVALSRFPSVYQLYWLVARIAFQLESKQISESGIFDFAKEDITSFTKSLREKMTFDILKNIKDAGLGSDGKTRVYIDDFVGVKDLDAAGKAKVSGDDRVFTSSMAVNALITTWTLQQDDGTLKFIKGTKDSVRIAVNSLVNYVSSAVLNAKTPLDGAFMADTVKNCNMLPALYPSNIITNREGKVVKATEPSNTLRFGIKDYILDEDYTALLKASKFKDVKPDFTKVKDMNRDDALFHFWTSPAYTKAAALLAIAQAANLAIGNNFQYN